MRELTIVYEGPGLGGRTTSIQQIASMLEGAQYTYEQLAEYAPGARCVVASDALTLAAKAQTGSVKHAEIHARFRAEADAIVFVADSQAQRLEINQEARDDLVGAYAPGAMPPVVLQLNKRDLKELTPVSTLARLFPDAPRFISIAPRSMGVWEAFATAATLAAERRDLLAEVRALLARGCA
jgi:hypothetical protein